MASTLFFNSVSVRADTQADGLAALDHADYARARELFSAAVQADPKDYSALFNLAFAESALHQDASAIDHLKQVLVLRPQLYEAELNLGMLYLRNRQAALAVSLLEDAVRQKPNATRAQQYLGEAREGTGDHAGAAQAFAAAANADPKSAAVHLRWGQSLAAAGKLDEALTQYQACVALDAHMSSYLVELAQAFENAGRGGDAISLLRQVSPEPGVQEELGRLLLAAGKPDDAAEQFRAAVTTAPTTANKLALATALLRTSHPETAEPLLAEALQSNPNDYDVLLAIGKIELGKRDFAVASKIFLKAASLKPESPEPWSEAASSSILAEQYGQALAALDRLRALGAEKAGDIYYRAVVFDKLHQPKPALASYQQFLQVSHGQFPDQEFIARHRSITLQKEVNR